MFNLGPLYKNHSGLCGKLGDPYQTEGEQESRAVKCLCVATSHITTTGQQHHSNDGQCVSVAVVFPLWISIQNPVLSQRRPVSPSVGRLGRKIWRYSYFVLWILLCVSNGNNEMCDQHRIKPDKTKRILLTQLHPPSYAYVWVKKRNTVTVNGYVLLLTLHGYQLHREETFSKWELENILIERSLKASVKIFCQNKHTLSSALDQRVAKTN